MPNTVSRSTPSRPLESAPVFRVPNRSGRVAPFDPLLTVDLVTADALDECVCEADNGCGALLIDHAYHVHVFGQRSKLVCSWACVVDMLREVSL